MLKVNPPLCPHPNPMICYMDHHNLYKFNLHFLGEEAPPLQPTVPSPHLIRESLLRRRGGQQITH